MQCVFTITYAISINGKMGSVFKPTRGLRQGNPLSPFLFFICSKGLSTLMRLAVKDGLLKEAKTSRNDLQISHLLFANYYILFGMATLEGSNVLKMILSMKLFRGYA